MLDVCHTYRHVEDTGSDNTALEPFLDFIAPQHFVELAVLLRLNLSALGVGVTENVWRSLGVAAWVDVALAFGAAGRRLAAGAAGASNGADAAGE